MNDTFHREHNFIIGNNLSHHYGNMFRPQWSSSDQANYKILDTW
jgi:hypothetical protein